MNGKLCANKVINGCKNIVNTRGTIICDDCSNVKKTRHDLMDELMKKNHDLEQKIIRLKSVNIPEVHDNFLLKENQKLTETIEKMHSDIEILVQNKEEYIMTHDQLKLDKEKLLIDVESLKTQYAQLLEENNLLKEENKKLEEVMEK